MSDDYAFRFQYADGSAFQIYADGRAYIMAKDGSIRDEPKGIVTNRIPILIGMVAKPRQDEIERLRGELERSRGLLTLALHTEGRSVIAQQELWQPIEAFAPPNPDDVPSYWSFHCLLSEGRTPFEGLASFTYKKKNLVWKRCMNGNSCSPTHWMPLPDGPTLPSTSGQAAEKTEGGASTYCAHCDHEHQLHEDARGFHHVIRGERVPCCSFPPADGGGK